MTSEYPPTQFLVLEVLAARHRLGEPHWPFPQTCAPAIRSLAEKGLVEIIKDHDPVGAIRAALTATGVIEVLSETYEPPILAKRDVP